MRRLLVTGGAGFIGLIVMSIIAPMAAMIIQMAISRSREYLADATGAQIAGNPAGLAGALEKLGAYSKRLPMDANPSTAHMFIVNPLSGRSMMSLFSTHPPIEERIARLRGVRPPSQGNKSEPRKETGEAKARAPGINCRMINNEKRFQVSGFRCQDAEGRRLRADNRSRKLECGSPSILDFRFRILDWQ